MLCGISGVVGYRLGRGDAPQPENVSAAPAQRQDDGSLIRVRAPAEHAPPAPHAIPRHAVRERAIGVDLQPAREDCPPVHVDLSLIREGDGRRMIASSPDGEVIGGFDVPIVAGLVPPPTHRWAAGVRYDPFWRAGGVWLARDVSRIRSEEHTSELQSLMRISYAVFCLKTKTRRTE